MTYCVGEQRSWALKGVPHTASTARGLLRELLAGPLHAEWLDDAQLALTEIVTNVVLHAHSDLVLTIRVEHGRLCVQVRDDSLFLPVEWDGDPEATTGRGIALVRHLTSAYGAQVLPGGGKVVWFVMGAPEVGRSPWPVLDGSVPGVAASTPVIASDEAVQVVLAGVPHALWRSAAAQSAELMRELVLHHVEHPTETVSRADLAAAHEAMAQGVRALMNLTAEHRSATTGPGVLSLWVTPRQGETFALLRGALLAADRLSDADRLLRPAAPPEITAFCLWAVDQVLAQVAGAPAQAWTEDGHFPDRWSPAESTTVGWDKASVAASPRQAVAVDATNRIAAISASLAAMLGWQAEELVGRRFVVLIPARLRSAHVAGFQRFLATGEARVLGRTLELPMLHADGREIACLVRIDQVGTRVGHPVFVGHVTPVGRPVVGAPAQDAPVFRSTPSGADLTGITLGDLARLTGVLRNLGEGASSLQTLADRVCRYLYDHLLDEAGSRQTLLVRFYATLALGDLPAEDQELARAMTEMPLTGDASCVTLLGSVGDQPSWNDRKTSRGGRVFPLSDPAWTDRLPMLAEVVRQLEIDVPQVLGRRTRLHQLPAVERYDVFHVADRTEDVAHPAHAFYKKYGVHSQFGFGGVLPNGGMFGIMVFSRTRVEEACAAKFETVAHSVTLGAFAKTGIPVFEGGPRTDHPGQSLTACQRLATQKGIVTSLLAAHERVAADESTAAVHRLEKANFETQRYAALARTLQASLLPPKLPTIAGLQIGAAFRPAGDGSEIGGDFYDLFPTSDGRFGFVLGDVSGKGAQAAALTSLARHTVRAAAFYAPGTCQVLTVLDQAVADEGTDDRYLTALFAFLTTAPGRVTIDLALGGHPRPLVLRAAGGIESVGVKGGALGLFPDPGCTETRFVLRSGDVFVAYSDGVTEARCGAEEFGEGRLRTLLAQSYGLAAPELARRIETDVLQFQSGHARDDIAVVVLRCP